MKGERGPARREEEGMGSPHCGHPGHPAPSPKVARAALEAEMVRNHRFFNRKFNRPGTQARTRPGAAHGPHVARAALEAEMVRNHRFFNKKFNRPGTQARTRPGAPPMAHMWPEQRWRRKWSEIIHSLIESLIGQGHRPELGQEPRPWPTCGPSSAGGGNGPKSSFL